MHDFIITTGDMCDCDYDCEYLVPLLASGLRVKDAFAVISRFLPVLVGPGRLGVGSELDRSKPQLRERRQSLVSGAETGRPADHQRYFLDGKTVTQSIDLLRN